MICQGAMKTTDDTTQYSHMAKMFLNKWRFMKEA
jgi:hypothetical protein